MVTTADLVIKAYFTGWSRAEAPLHLRILDNHQSVVLDSNTRQPNRNAGDVFPASSTSTPVQGNALRRSHTAQYWQSETQNNYSMYATTQTYGNSASQTLPSTYQMPMQQAFSAVHPAAINQSSLLQGAYNASRNYVSTGSPTSMQASLSYTAHTLSSTPSLNSSQGARSNRYLVEHRTVVLAGLNDRTKKDVLKDLLSSTGYRSFSYGYKRRTVLVKYESTAEALAAISRLQGYRLDGRHLRARLAKEGDAVEPIIDTRNMIADLGALQISNQQIGAAPSSSYMSYGWSSFPSTNYGHLRSTTKTPAIANGSDVMR
ncbi:Hypothetical protein D9617_46g064470 [Elsinoe fawcettii]|nr:Hypothetical protein D9617_46g064470 [Elsinoe fawcettii]